MDGVAVHSPAVLTRSTSSHLRSSPTVHRSSSLSQYHPPHPNHIHDKKNKSLPRWKSRLLLSSLLFPAAFYLSFFYWRKDGTPASENLLSSLVFFAAVLYSLSRHWPFIHRNLSFLKTLLCAIHSKRFNLSRGSSKSVQWFIGDSKGDPITLAVTREGIRKNKMMIREGVEFFSNGDFYEGEFNKGRCNGSGVYSYFAKGRYEGDWVDGKRDGYGVESWSRGSKYRGQYRNGLRHGCGVYWFYTGDSYSGEWWNGQSHGVGLQSCKDGSCFVGEFKCGVKHGLGCYYFRNGDRYAGEYFNDKVHGFGVYQFANGHSYEGSWHEGCKQGYGLYTFSSGATKCGVWDSGHIKSTVPPSSDAAFGAIQAARKAAGNAIHLRRVEEEVNKAVLAASRAATAARVAAVKALQNRMDGKFCDVEA